MLYGKSQLRLGVQTMNLKHSKLKVTVSALVLTVLFINLSSLTASESAGDIYVAPAGSDGNSGAFDKPVGTIRRAQQLVREKIKSDPTQPVTVILRGGRYELTEPIVFTDEDSGTNQAAVIYTALPGETPVLSGGRILSGWKKKSKNTWSTIIPAVQTGKWYFRQLYADGQRLSRGRYPAEGFITISEASPDAKTFKFDQKLPGELGGSDVELIVIQNWSIARAVIAEHQGQNLTCGTPLGWIGHGACTASAGKKVFLENKLEFLNQPGQWYLERATGELTYRSGDNEDPTDKLFVAPYLEQMLIIEGTAQKPIRNLYFKGIVFAHAGWQLLPGGYRGIQAGYNGEVYIPKEMPEEEALPVAIKLKYAQDCGFEKCRFLHIGSSAIGLSAGTRRNRIVGCEVADIGANGIHIGFPDRPIKVLDEDWSNPDDVPTGNEVSNCYIHHCGKENFGCVGLFTAFTENTRFTHNYVCKMPYTGISVGFRWSPTPSSQKNCIVEYNHIHDVMLKLADGGGIYTLGTQPGTVIRGNHIYNIHRSSYAHGGAPNNGIFIDESSSGFLFENNIIYKTSGDAIRFGACQSQWHTWRNNSLGIMPDAKDFPQTAAKHAGIETPYQNWFDMSH